MYIVIDLHLIVRSYDSVLRRAALVALRAAEICDEYYNRHLLNFLNQAWQRNVVRRKIFDLDLLDLQCSNILL